MSDRRPGRADLESANRCVMCGLCLPHCPTYRKTRDESESPRGRISLIRAFGDGSLPVTGRLTEHLDNCLSCRACEAVCPARVPYGALLDNARATLLDTRPAASRFSGRMGRGLVTNRLALALASTLLAVYRKTGLQRLLRASGLARLSKRVARLERMLSPAQATAGKPAGQFEPPSRRAPVVSLFRGCVSRITDADTLRACEAMLERLGFRVEVPRRQTCCGALHLHAGDRRSAAVFLERNIQAFGRDATNAIVSAATGCGVQLHEAAPELCGAPGEALSRRHADISVFLARHPWPDSLQLSPLKRRVAIHTPCSQANVLGGVEEMTNLLSRIPDIDLAELADNRLCCGAAGSHMLTHPRMADELARDKVSLIRASGANIVVTSNVGCRMHLQGAASASGLNLEILHPVTLLARQAGLS
ncbi:MAG: (Fe-S)-binding protein [Pseudomonadota bacterium]|nr:(Fe-S)-binding protein [Pseudomonadota bacterium]